MRDKISIGVVGCGYWGPNLIRNFFEHASADLAYVCDLEYERLSKIGKRYPTTTLVTDYRHLLDDERLDAVAIATPVSSHFELAKKALLAGKHVLVEKPMCQTSAECQELVSIAEAQKRVLMVDHTFVYHPAVRRIKQEIETGELGEILYFDSVRINLGVFQRDVNVVMDLAAHDFSILDYLVQQLPISISATGASHTKNRLESIAYITMKFPNDMIGHFHVSWLSPVKIRKILIGGTKKMIVYDDLDPTDKVRIYDKGISLEPVEGESRYEKLIQYRVGDMFAPAIAADEALRIEISHFIECIRTGSRPDTDGVSGLRVVKMLETTNQALKHEQSTFLDSRTKIAQVH